MPMGPTHRLANRDIDLQQLRSMLWWRLVLAALLAIPCTAGLAAIPNGSRSSRHATFAPDELLLLVTARYGWPSKIVLHTEIAIGNDKRSRAVTDDDLRRLPFSIGPLHAVSGWRVEWGNGLRLYGVLAGLWIILLTHRPLLRLRQLKLRRAAETCHVCGYPKIGLPLPRCPECGTPHGKEQTEG